MATRSTSKRPAEIFASVKEWEVINVTGGDQNITINGGVAMALYCDTAGEVLTIDTTGQTNSATPSLQAGMNAWECTKVYQTGTVIAGTVYAVSW